MNNNLNLRGLVLALGLTASGLAQAGTTYSYVYDYNWSVPSSCTSSWSSSCELSGGTRSLLSSTAGAPADPSLPPSVITNVATGWSNTGGDKRVLGDNQTLEKGTVLAWGGTGGNGLGIQNQDNSSSGEDGSNSNNYDSREGSTPEHAMDNNQRRDSMLYSFSSSIALTDVMITYAGGYNYEGQTQNDSDIIVLAYTGDDPFTLASKLDGKTYGSLVGLGWQLIGNYSNLTAGVSTGINAGGVSSSYWLIGTANTLITGGTNDSKLDYVKLGALGGTVTTQYTPPSTPPGNSVPEPGSVLLLGLGSLLLARARMKTAA